VSPANNDPENAITLEGINLQVDGTLLWATHRPVDSWSYHQDELAGVWYQWTPPTDGMIAFSHADDSTPVEIFVFYKESCVVVGSGL